MIAEELQGRTIGFKRGYMRVVGSVTAALLLSQAMYWQDVCAAEGRQEWYKTGEDWEEETGLTRREIDGARAKLRALGILLEVKRGIPAKIWYRVDEARLTELLRASETNAPKRQTVCTKAPNSMHQTAKLYAPKRQTNTEITQRLLHIPPMPPQGGGAQEQRVAADAEAQRAWRAVQAELAKRVNVQSFNTWLKPGRARSLGNGVLVIALPHATYGHVADKYGPVIRDALTVLDLPVSEVQFTLPQPNAAVPDEHTCAASVPLSPRRVERRERRHEWSPRNARQWFPEAQNRAPWAGVAAVAGGKT